MSRRKALYGSADRGNGCPTIDVNCGAIFELRPPAVKGNPWRYKAIYRFKGGTADGHGPIGDLTLHRGALYGVTETGGLGSFGNGTVFRLAPPTATRAAWAETVLYKFKGGSDGATPKAGLAVGPGGALYGTTNFGGGCRAIPVGCGVVYRLIPPQPGRTAWTEQVIFRFAGAGRVTSP